MMAATLLLIGAFVGVVLGLALAMYVGHRARTRDPMILRGSQLRRIAWEYYGVRPRLFESDESIRHRCRERMNGVGADYDG